MDKRNKAQHEVLLQIGEGDRGHAFGTFPANAGTAAEMLIALAFTEFGTFFTNAYAEHRQPVDIYRTAF